MSPPRVLLCRGDLPTKLLDEAHQAGKIDLIKRNEEDKQPLREWALSHLQDSDAILITFALTCDKEIIEAGKKLKAVATMSVGTDHIDMEACRQRGIPVFTTTDSLDETVAETTLMLTLGITRCIPFASRITREGDWANSPWTPFAFCGTSLKGKTIGFLGFGSIAQTAISYFLPFKVGRILYGTSKPRPFDLSDNYFAKLRQSGFNPKDLPIENQPDVHKLASESDVIILLMNLSPSSKHLVNKQFLAKMKPSANLINVARGGIVDTTALADALRNNRIAGAALDTIENEPNIPANHELLQPDCRDRVIMLPHIGSATFETRKRMANVVAEKLLDLLG